MNIFLILAFLFFIGSIAGWFLELFFRRFFSQMNPERKWINPGFLVGPYIPLYGFGLCILYSLAQVKLPFIYNEAGRQIVRFVVMMAATTALEYVVGVICIKLLKVRLWDYSKNWGNVKGIICPGFSLCWALLGAIYYFLVHPYTLGALEWLSENLAFSFVVGFFFGIMIVDVCYSANIIAKVRKFASENNIEVIYEELKEHIRKSNAERLEKARFIFAFKSGKAFAEHLRDYKEIRRNFRLYK